MSESPAVAHQPAHLNEILSFTVAGQTLALPILAVQEVRSFEPPTPMPGMKDGFRGILNLRGQLVPIFDIAKKLGLGSLIESTQAIIIVVQAGGRAQGLAVDAVNDVIAYSTENIRDPGLIGGAQLTTHVSGLLDVGGKIIQILDCSKALELPPEAQAEPLLNP